LKGDQNYCKKVPSAEFYQRREKKGGFLLANQKKKEEEEPRGFALKGILLNRESIGFEGEERKAKGSTSP